MAPSSSVLLLAKTITHLAARSLCDSWASCIFDVYFLLVVVSLVAIDCLEGLLSQMTCYVSIATLNSTYSQSVVYILPCILKGVYIIASLSWGVLSCLHTEEVWPWQLKAYLFHIWYTNRRNIHHPRHCCGVIRDSGAGYKTADLLAYLLGGLSEDCPFTVSGTHMHPVCTRRSYKITYTVRQKTAPLYFCNNFCQMLLYWNNYWYTYP